MAFAQPRAMQAWNEGRPFRETIAEDEDIAEHLSAEAINEAFDPQHHLRRVDEIFERVGLG